MKRLIEEILERYPVTDSKVSRPDQAWITVPKDKLVDILCWLQRTRGFTHLAFFTVVDYLEQGKFQLTYMLHNYADHLDLGVRVLIDRENATMESIHHLWEHAQTFQREWKEMFGIDFPGSPRMDEPLILEGWDGPPPYRRDFDTKKYSEETYFPRPGRESHDPREHMKKKLYPDPEES